MTTFKPKSDNPAPNLFSSVWSQEDVEQCLGEDNEGALTDKEKNDCLQALVDLISQEIGMEYLREIVFNTLEEKNNQ